MRDSSETAPRALRSLAPGVLVAVEGLDGSGKSTQIHLLKRWLEMEGCRVHFTEWNSSALVRKATRKAKKAKQLTPTTFSLIHCADFADRYERQIMPLLRAGYIVLADRYVYTAFARDAVRRCDPKWLRNLYRFAVCPDITLFFKLPLAQALERILATRPKLKYHEAGMDLDLSLDPYESFRIFQGRVNREYLKIAREYKFDVIDATQSIERQQSSVRHIVAERIDLDAYRLRRPT